MAAKAFTLVELMVSVSILVILMLVVANFIGLVQRTWVRTSSNVSQFREARLAFDIMTRTISQATLNTYWQTKRDKIGTSISQSIYTSTRFSRQSELQFVSGNTSGFLFPGVEEGDYPGHGVFFQAPLGVTGLLALDESDTVADTNNMVNLMCGRGYFVAWGDDLSFRPAFLEGLVPPRLRLRLMEFSPTAEMNRIYDSTRRPLVDALGNPTSYSKMWFTSASTASGGTESASTQTAAAGGENESSRAFTRPVAENILALIISPQVPTIGNLGQNPYRIAPTYAYDSLMQNSPGASLTAEFGEQGTQHVLPPVIKVTMVALDARGGERMSFDTSLRESVVSEVSSRFDSAASYQADLEALEQALVALRLDYRVFSTSIPLKQGRWSK